MENNKLQADNNLLPALVHKFLPFWPLFAVLLAITLTVAWGYLRYFAIPVYEVSASLLIKDEEKGVSDSKMAESIDAFTSNKIVENEIKVIHSRTMIDQVVKDLHLYAPVYEEGRFKTTHAYATSPIVINVRFPDKIVGVEQVYFNFDTLKNEVKINNKVYPLNKWVKTPYGSLRFTKNPIDKSSSDKNPLYFSLVEPKYVTDYLFGQLRIEAENKLSTVIDLKLNDPVPERGQDVLNKLIETYRQLAINEKYSLASNTLQFVEDRIKLVEKELDDLESEVVEYKSTKGVVDLSEQGRLFLNSVGENDRKIADINIQLAVLDQVEGYVRSKNNMAGIVPSTLGINDPVLAQLLQKLSDTEIQYHKLRNTTAENNPILMSLTEEMDNIRPRVLENIKNQRVNLIASRSKLDSNNQTYSNALQTIPQKERELMELNRQQTIKTTAYSFLLQKREEAILSYAPTALNNKVVDLATASILPISPKPFIAYLTAFVLALALCIGFVMSKEIFNSKVLFRSEIEEFTHIPIVAELSHVKNKATGIFETPSDLATIEQFRQLRATMGLYTRTFSKKKIMVTSSIPGEGKSFVSTNLAYSLASSGKQVVLLDFDLRNPNTSSLFDLYQQVGIIDYLESELSPADIINPTSFKNLNVVSAGQNVGDHTELLLNGKLEELFIYLEQTFDYILIDTPPIELVTDAYLLSEFCDITLLVMRHAVTPKKIVQRLGQDNRLLSLNKVAIIFNGVKPRGIVKGQYGYGYGYGYENKYGDKTYRTRGSVA